MQPVSPRVVELLNEALTFELTVTNTYFLHARMLDNWGLSRLGKVYYDLSIDEMKDADALINRILMFDGHPNVQRLNNIAVGENPEEMLRLALDSEKAAVAQFNASAEECHELGDHGTAAVFEEMVRDEETHADWFEGQIDALERVGRGAVPRPADRLRLPGLTQPRGTLSRRLEDCPHERQHLHVPRHRRRRCRQLRRLARPGVRRAHR